MKEMIYSAELKREILDTGFYLGFLYYIMNLGTHPTAYIRIPEKYKNKIDNIEVNGGITYSEKGLWVEENKKIEGYFIGWDYAHYGDYFGFEEAVPMIYRTGGKKWTTKEILDEVKSACEQIKKLEE